MQCDGQKVSTSHRTTARTSARLYHSVSDYDLSFFFFFFYSVFRSQQHGLLHGERLLCVPVVWSSEQLGELLPHDGLLLLELCPVVEQAVRVGRERELLNRRHLGPLEARRAGDPARGRRGQLILRRPREPVYRPPGPALWRVVRGVRLASPVPFEPVVHWSVHLCGGGELLQVDGGGAALCFQLQGVLRRRPGVAGGGVRRRLPAVGGEGVVHESLLRGEAARLPLGGGVRSLPVRHAGGWSKPGGRSVESVLSSVVQAHGVGGMEDGDLRRGSGRGVLLRRGVVLAVVARVTGVDARWTVVDKRRRKGVFGHPGP